MSILDTFTILFNSNAEEVKKGAEEATKAGVTLEHTLKETGEVGAHAGKEIEEENSRLAESFDKVKEHMAEWGDHVIEKAFEVAAAFKAIFEVEELVDNFFEQAEISDKLGEQAKSLGVSVEQLDAWGNAAKRVGGTAEGFAESLSNVNRMIERQIATGSSRSKKIFEELGVSFEDAHKKAIPIFDLLPKLTEQIEKKGFNKQESSGLLRSLGFDDGTIRLVQLGSKELSELLERQKKLGLITAEDTEVAERFNREWDDIKQLFRSITVDMDTAFLPILEDVLDIVEGVIEYLEQHKNLVIGFFIGLAAAVIYAGEAFGFFDFMASLLLDPIALVIIGVIALIAAFAFLYDDIMAFATGHNSVVGEMAKKWPVFGEAVWGLIAIFKYLKNYAVEAIKNIIAWIVKLPQGLREWGEIIAFISSVIAVFVDTAINKFKELFPNITKLLDDIGAAFKTSLPIWTAVFSAGITTIEDIFAALLLYVMSVFKLISDLFIDPEHAFQTFGTTCKQIIDDLIAKFPDVTKAFDNVGDAFKATGDAIKKVWQDIIAEVERAIQTIEHPIAAIRSAISGAQARAAGHDRIAPGSLTVGGKYPAAAPAAPVQAGGLLGDRIPGLAQAQTALTPPGSALLSAPPAASLAAPATVNQTNSVTVGPTTITTGSTDPAAVGAIVDQRMGVQTRQAIDHLASGVSH